MSTKKNTMRYDEENEDREVQDIPFFQSTRRTKENSAYVPKYEEVHVYLDDQMVDYNVDEIEFIEQLPSGDWFFHLREERKIFWNKDKIQHIDYSYTKLQ